MREQRIQPIFAFKQRYKTTSHPHKKSGVQRLPRYLFRKFWGLALFSLALLGSGGLAYGDVVIKAESNGFPGARSTDDAVITMSIKQNAMRIVNPIHFHVVTIRLDRDKFWEMSAYKKEYVEKSIASFDKYRLKREQAIKDQIAEYHKLKDSDLKERALRSLKNAGVRLDGKIIAKSVRSKKTKTFTVMVDGRTRKLKCYQLLIYENEALKPSFELWLSPDLDIEANVLQFYRLGTFSKAVLGELKKVKDFPVYIQALVDTGSAKKTIHSTIQSIENERVPGWHMIVPKGFKTVKTLKEKAPAGPKVYCAECRKHIPDTTKGETWKKPGLNTTRYFFCNSACRKAFIRSAKWRKKKPKSNSRTSKRG